MVSLNFDDRSQTTFYIPYTPDDEVEDSTVPLPGTPCPQRDILNGRALRLNGYQNAWTKCMEKMQAILTGLTTPIADTVVQEVRNSHTDVLPGLPFPELPVIALANPDFGSTFLNNVTSRLDTFVTHLYPPDCLNITSGMRSLVLGLIEHERGPARVKHKPTTSLANYDIGLLVSWFKVVEVLREFEPEMQTDLVVVVHDFEQFDPTVMQDIFYICSTHISQLPLVFLLSMSSPIPSYLHMAYPRSTLARLRIKNVTVPSGMRVLNEIITKTFFAVDFQPDVMIGPTALQFLADFYMRHNSTVDSVLTAIQLVHLKHFTTEPLTILVHSTPSNDSLSGPESFAFMDALLSRTWSSSSEIPPDSLADEWRSLRISGLLTSVDDHRSSFHARARAFRVAFRIMKLTQEFFVKEGYKGLGWNLDDLLCDVLIDILQNNMNKDLKDLGMLVRKLKIGQLRRLLNEYHNFLTSTQLQEVAEALEQVDAMSDSLASNTFAPSQVGGQVASEISDWVVNYISSLVTPLEEVPLWDVWYTGLSPFPSELLNPSVRASTLAGLMRPLEFQDPSSAAITLDSDESLWELPDTSILFKRYLDSGKMINVYDWFESFQAVLETQRTQLNATRLKAVSPKKSRSPRKQSAKVKGKQRQVDEADDGDEQDTGLGSEERWKIEVQARFIRAMHELDYLGFIKHTKRRVDHVVRTAFDITE